MAISPPRTPAPANGRAKNLSTPDILAAMMDSDSEDELVRPGPPPRARVPAPRAQLQAEVRVPREGATSVPTAGLAQAAAW